MIQTLYLYILFNSIKQTDEYGWKMSGSGDQVENDFKIFPKLGTAKSEIFTTSWPTPAGTVEPVELSGIKLTVT